MRPKWNIMIFGRPHHLDGLTTTASAQIKKTVSVIPASIVPTTRRVLVGIQGLLKPTTSPILLLDLAKIETAVAAGTTASSLLDRRRITTTTVKAIATTIAMDIIIGPTKEVIGNRVEMETIVADGITTNGEDRIRINDGMRKVGQATTLMEMANLLITSASVNTTTMTGADGIPKIIGKLKNGRQQKMKVAQNILLS